MPETVTKLPPVALPDVVPEDEDPAPEAVIPTPAPEPEPEPRSRDYC